MATKLELMKYGSESLHRIARVIEPKEEAYYNDLEKRLKECCINITVNNQTGKLIDPSAVKNVVKGRPTVTLMRLSFEYKQKDDAINVIAGEIKKMENDKLKKTKPSLLQRAVSCSSDSRD